MWYELEGQKYTLTDIRRRHPDVLFPPGEFDPGLLGYVPCDPPDPVEVTLGYQDAWRALAERYEANRQQLMMAFVTAESQGNAVRKATLQADLSVLKNQYRADQAALDQQYA